jgi:hypothetical protein
LYFYEIFPLASSKRGRFEIKNPIAKEGRSDDDARRFQ